MNIFNFCKGIIEPKPKNKFIINGTLYDPNISKLIFTYYEEIMVGHEGDYRNQRKEIYKTKNGNYFQVTDNKYCRPMFEFQVKKIVEEINVDKYLELFKVKEA